MGFRFAMHGRLATRILFVAGASSGALVVFAGEGCSSSNKGVDTLGAGDDSGNVFIPPETGGLTFDATMMNQPETSTADAEAGPGCGEAGDGGKICGTRCVDTSNDPTNCGDCSVACANMTPGTVCVMGQCQCPGDGGVQVCGNKCVDTTSDPSNCGFCAHNCQGNLCQSGLCQPNEIAVVAAAGEVINDIAVTSLYVFWTWTTPPSAASPPGTAPTTGVSQKSFGSTATDPPTARTPVTAGDLRGITYDPAGTNIYWVDHYNDFVQYEPITSSSTTPLFLFGGGGDGGTDAGMSTAGPSDVAVDGKNVYWVDEGAGTVNQTPLPQANGTLGAVTVLATGQGHPIAIAVDSMYVYWINHGTTQAGSGSVNRIAIGAACGNTCVLTLADKQNQPADIAVDATNVYWTSSSNAGSVSTVTIGGAQLKVLAQNLGAPYGIAVDTVSPVSTVSDPSAERFVYWTNFDDNTVSKLSLSGTTMTPYPLASQPGKTPSAIAIDQKNVYWANQADGTIWKVAK